MQRAITFLATGAYVGLIPVASGTFGSLLGIPPLIAAARWNVSPPVVVTVIVVAAVLAMAVCQRAGALAGDADSSTIVLDEICGMFVAGALLPATVTTLTLAFVLFRLFDVVKPFPASYLDREVRNGVGVVADDLVAGLYANLCVRLLT